MHMQRSPVPVPVPFPSSAKSDTGTDTDTNTPTNPSSGFPCPAADKSGAAVAARTQTTVDDITTVTCTYHGATGTCIYNGVSVLYWYRFPVPVYTAIAKGEELE